MSTAFAVVAACSQAVSATRSRKRKTAALIECLRAADDDEIGIICSWLTGELPQGRIGLGPTILRAVADTPATKESDTTVAEVNAAVDAIAAIAGKGAIEKRKAALSGLLARLTESEQSFLLRLLLGELRQGALEGVMTDAIAATSEIDHDRVRRAVMVSGQLAAVAAAALNGGEDALDAFAIRVGTPLQPMLAQTADDIESVFAGLDQAVLEHKLDGARVQVHRDGDVVRIYTRRLNDVTARLPEIVEQVQSLPGAATILDGEVIALRDDGRPHPFQVTMQRFGRQFDIDRMQAEIPLSVAFFDLVYNDTDLTLAPARERYAIMDELLPPALVIPRLLTADSAAAQAFFDAAIDAGHEGVMAKDPDSVYEAGNRGASWLKIKPAHTLDLVILAAEWGSGRRKGFLSNLHLGAFDPDNGSWVMLGKTFKGLTDAMLQWQTEQLLQLETHRDRHVVYVQPAIVVEIAFNELQRSRQYPAGLALRFARVKG
ncbi:MAG: ATP-dependent DNA ligase, partial [Gammaproteobacteria bacterium]|nr:ATP-dependent DNA ligase [Gammaproteobacteria bacterium]